jgi:hypothetical protein
MPQKTLHSMSFSGHTSKRAYGTTSGSYTYTYGKYCNYGPFTTTCSGETIYYYKRNSICLYSESGYKCIYPIVCACYNANMEQVKCPPCIRGQQISTYINGV